MESSLFGGEDDDNHNAVGLVKMSKIFVVHDDFSCGWPILDRVYSPISGYDGMPDHANKLLLQLLIRRVEEHRGHLK